MRKKLTKKQKERLPANLLAAIEGKKKHMDADDKELKHPEKADLNKDGKLSSYEKKRGKAVEDAMDDDDDNDHDDDKECSCGCDDPKDCTCDKKDKKEWSGVSLPTFSEWLEWRQNQ